MPTYGDKITGKHQEAGTNVERNSRRVRHFRLEGRLSLTTRLKNWGALRWTIAVLSCAYAIVFIYMLIARPGTKEFYHGFFNVYQILPPLFGGLCGLILAIRGKHPKLSVRLGWMFVGLGSLSFSIGQMTWTYIETIQGKEVPFPS